MKPYILATLLVLMSAGSADCMAYRFVDIGDPYPSFCAKQFNGDQICSDSYENKIVIISFFTLDQMNSQKVLIDLEEISAKYGAKNVSIVGILSGEVDRQALSEFVTTNTITIPILLDSDRQIYGDFGVFLYPSTGIFARGKSLKYYLPARRLNFKQHVDGYIRFLLEEISESELEKIIHPSVDKTDPNYKKAENYCNFANLFFGQGKFEKAKGLLELSIKTCDKYAPAYSLYGYIYIQSKEYRRALENFELALTIDPDFKAAKTGRQICLDNLGTRMK